MDPVTRLGADNASVGGERIGDTLKRLARLIRVVAWETSQPDVTTEDWRAWLDELGDRMNNAAEEE